MDCRLTVQVVQLSKQKAPTNDQVYAQVWVPDLPCGMACESLTMQCLCQEAYSCCPEEAFNVTGQDSSQGIG